MPCEDITEVLHMTFDPEDVLTGYELNKRTCGRAVGESSLLNDWAVGRRAEELVADDLDRFIAQHPAGDEVEEFLFLKHFFALRMGLLVYLGREPGGSGDACALASLSYGEDGAEFEAELRVDVLTEEIKACGRCGSACGKKKPAKV